MAKPSTLGRSLQKQNAKRRTRNKGIELGEKYPCHNETAQVDMISSVVINSQIEQLMFIKEIKGEGHLITKNNYSTVLNPNEIVSVDSLSKFSTVFKRPPWTENMTPHEIQSNENAAFLQYKRCLYQLQQSDKKTITPFEKNIEIWRQLWRVIEKSDLICQIVDVRNPMFFYSLDIVQYVKEVDPSKSCILLANKSDLLTSDQISDWKTYFNDHGISAYFYSAMEKTIETDHEKCKFLTDKKALIEIFHRFKTDRKICEKITVGFIGFPNVGKSSTINNLIGTKKTSVSFTPGKTKHLQTLHFDDHVILCDCPGLVLPQFVNSKEELIINGILPIDQTKEAWPTIDLLVHILPRIFFEFHYSTTIVSFTSSDFCTSDELLTSLAFSKNFLGHKSVPDYSKMAKLVLKDVTSGKLAYCYPPPGLDFAIFNKFDQIQLQFKTNSALENKIRSFHSNKSSKVLIDEVDKKFFKKVSYDGNNVINLIKQHNLGVNIHSLRKGPKKPKKEKLRKLYKNND